MSTDDATRERSPSLPPSAPTRQTYALVVAEGPDKGQRFFFDDTLPPRVATPLGVVLGMSAGGWASGTVVATLLGLAAGGFLYISMADILTRIHKSRDLWCWVLLVAGVAVSVLLPHP